MTVAERAWQVWSLLAFAARNRQTLTYELVGQLTGMATPGLGAVLEPIQSYCLLNGLPALSALVVNKSTGLPGTGFIAAEDLPKEFIRIFERDWLALGCPTPDMLADAVRRQPSNGIIPPGRGPVTVSKGRHKPRGESSGSGRKYEPLRAYLASQRSMPRLRMTFAEVEAVLGSSLPESARKHRAWWSNLSDRTNRPQAAAWLDAEFEVGLVDQSGSGYVDFVLRTAPE
jgi:hypothetical protein